MDRHITQEDIDKIMEVKNNEENFDLSIDIDINDNYRVEDMTEGDIIIITIPLLNGGYIKRECQIIDSNRLLLLLTEEDEPIQLRYDDDNEKYHIVSSE